MTVTSLRIHEFKAQMLLTTEPPLTELALYYEYPEELHDPHLRQILGSLRIKITTHEIPILTMTQEEFADRFASEFAVYPTPLDIKIIGPVSHTTEQLLAALPTTVLYEYSY